jgi:hypothetical protein
MTILDDVKELEEHLSPCADSPLKWVVSGQPVVAVFPLAADDTNPNGGYDHTGQPSPHNKVPDSLVLWIGFDQAASRLLLMLTQRIKVSSTSKSRLMFLIVPVEALVLQLHDPSFWNLSKEKLSPSLFDVPSDAKSAQGSRLLKMSFSIDASSKTHVVMPAHKYEGDVPRHSLSLLRKLKALSESSHFELFTSHNSWIQAELFKTRNMLQTACLKTPKLDLQKLYPGPRDGGLDNWEEQGWHDRDDGKLEQAEASVSRRPKKRGRGTAQAIYKRHRQLSSSPEARPPPYRQLPTSSSDPHFHDDSPLLRPSPVPECASAAAASAVHPSHHQSNRDKTRPTYKPTTEQCHDVSDSPRHEPATGTMIHPSAHAHHATPIQDYNSVATGTSVPGFRAIPRSSTPETTAHACLDNTSLSVVPETPVANPAVPSHDLDCDHGNSIVPQTEIAILLSHLWDICPYIHFVFIAELLELSTTSITDLEAFRKLRVVSMDAFLCHIANTSPVPSLSGQPSIDQKNILDREIRSLLTWLSILDPMADLNMFPSLAELARLKEQLVRMCTADDTDPDEYEGLLTKFKTLKAMAVTTSSTQYGAKFLQRENGIVARMLEAKERIWDC